MADDATGGGSARPPEIPGGPETTFRLLERVRTGDEAALNALLARYLLPLRRWASGRLPRWARDTSDTQDLVQETLINAFRKIEGFDSRGEGALQAYLRQALMNRIRDESSCRQSMLSASEEENR